LAFVGFKGTLKLLLFVFHRNIFENICYVKICVFTFFSAFESLLFNFIITILFIVFYT